MYKLIAAFSLALLCASAAGATDTGTANGRWWKALNAEERAHVTQGALAAYTAGWLEGRQVTLTATLDRLSGGLEQMHLAPSQRVDFSSYFYSEAGYKSIVGHPPVFPAPQPSYSDSLTAFYAEHPDDDDIDIGTVLVCLQESPREDCATLVAAWRKALKKP